MGVKHIEVPKKPVAPVMPSASDKKYRGTPQSTAMHDSPFVKDYRKWLEEKEKYERDLEIYEQTKMIKLIKNADLKLILKKFKVERR